MKVRRSQYTCSSSATDTDVELDLDGAGVADIWSGLAVLDHLLHTFAQHSRFDLTLASERAGDDYDADAITGGCAMALGQAITDVLGHRTGIEATADALAVREGSMARAAVDLRGGGAAWLNLGLGREPIGDLPTACVADFLSTLAKTARISLHLDLLKGDGDLHRAEAAFRALGIALRKAVVSMPAPHAHNGHGAN